MHYKNGREAKAGDKVLALPNGITGLLYSTVATSDYCIGRIAITSPIDPYVAIKECLHIDDVCNAVIPDSSK